MWKHIWKAFEIQMHLQLICIEMQNAMQVIEVNFNSNAYTPENAFKFI